MHRPVFVYCELISCLSSHKSVSIILIKKIPFFHPPTKKAQNPDELTIVENEQLEVVGEGDGKDKRLD
jgi:hypothetical protein